jgi:transcriptional regulator with XRE-family HTH domain
VSADIGRRIHLLRTGKGLSQRELAEPRYTAAFISSVEAGRRTPSSEALEHLASRLGVSAGELRTGRAADVDTQVDLALAEADRECVSEDGGRTTYERVLGQAEATASQKAHAHIGLGRAALRAAARLSADARRGGETSLAQADVLSRANALAEAARHFDQAETLLASALPHERAEATVGRAEILRAQGDPRYAVYLLAEIRDELARTGYPDPSALLQVHVQLTVCHSQLGDDAEAAASAGAALALAGRTDPARVADLHIATARTLLATGRLAEAAVALVQARQARREAALRPCLASCYRSRGRARGKTGDPAGAVADLTVARRLFHDAGRTGREVDTAFELAELHLGLGQRAQAAELLAAHAGVRSGRAERLRALMAGVSDPREAERCFRASVEAYRVAGPRDKLAQVVGELADLLEEQDRLDDAAEVMRAGLADVQRLTVRRD